MQKLAPERRFVRLSWLMVDHAKRMLLLRFYKRKMWFDPGGRMVLGMSDESALAQKIYRDLEIVLDLDSMEKVANFAAPAHDKPEGTMFETRCFTGRFEGALKPTKRVKELIWINSKHPEMLKPEGESLITEAGKGLLQNVNAIGLVA